MRRSASEAEGLGIMVQTISTCRRCGSDEIVELAIQVAGAPFRFTCCHHCETTTWESDGRFVPLHSVLELASSH
jgi:hypothetical protein